MPFEFEGLECEQALICELETVLSKISGLDPMSSINLAKDAMIRIAAHIVDTGSSSSSHFIRDAARARMHDLSFELSALSMQLQAANK